MNFTIDDILLTYRHVYCSVEAIPGYLYAAREQERYACIDLVTPLEKGKAWLFEELCRYQPRTCRILMDQSDDLLLAELSPSSTPEGYKHYSLKLFLKVAHQIIRIGRNTKGDNPHELEEADPKHWLESRQLSRYKALPAPIARAYYHRFDGLDIPEAAIPSYRMRRLPAGIYAPWESIDGYLAALRLKKKVMPLIEERFPETRPLHKSEDIYRGLQVFLDTRPLSYSGKEGDILIIKTGEIKSSSEDLKNPKFLPRIEEAQRMVRQEVYHVRDADFTRIRVLTDPVEAIDRYCEHTLLDRKERFDFLPFGREA